MTNPLAPEIIWFTPSESYFKDPISTFRAVSKAASARGLLGLVVDVLLKCKPRLLTMDLVFTMALTNKTHRLGSGCWVGLVQTSTTPPLSSRLFFI